MMNLFKHPGFLTIGYVLSRLILFPLNPVPSAVALDPLWVFAVLLILSPGRGWVFSLIPGLVFGDWMCGMGGGQIAMRLAGFILLSLFAPEGGFHRKYFLLMIPHALWSSLMPDWQGHFPLGYLFLVWVLQGVLWWGLLFPVKDGNSLRPVRPVFVIPAGLLVLHLFLPAPGLRPIPSLGDHSGLILQILAPLLLLPPLVTGFLNRSKPGRAAESIQASGGRWTHLAE